MNVTLLNRNSPTLGSRSASSDMVTPARYDKEFGLFDSVFHEVSDGIVIISREPGQPTPVIKDVNQHFELITGYELEDVHNRNLYDFLVDGKESPQGQIIEQSFAERKTALLRCAWITRKDSPLEVSMTIRPFTSDDQCSRFICVLRKNSPALTHRDKAAQEIKRSLLAAMHHNFRTPLNGILGYSEIIMTEMMGPVGQDTYREYAADIHGAGQSLLTLIDSLLELKELETTEFELIEEIFPVAELIDGCLKKIAREADSRQIALSGAVDPDFPALFGDRGRLQQVIHCLLANAMKFSLAGGRIILSARQASDGSCLICCEDNGAGMPPQQLAKVFCHDTQYADIYSNPTVGIGFGLSYVKRLVEKHDGTTSIVSSVGKGTTVTLHLPEDRLR